MNVSLKEIFVDNPKTTDDELKKLIEQRLKIFNTLSKEKIAKLNIEVLSCQRCLYIFEIPKILSEHLKILKCNRCVNLKKIPNFKVLEVLICDDCDSLENIPLMPKLKWLRCKNVPIFNENGIYNAKTYHQIIIKLNEHINKIKKLPLKAIDKISQFTGEPHIYEVNNKTKAYRDEYWSAFFRGIGSYEKYKGKEVFIDAWVKWMKKLYPENEILEKTLIRYYITKEKIILGYKKEFIQETLKICNKTYLLGLIYIEIKERSAHSNAIIFDCKKKQLIIYEPGGIREKTSQNIIKYIYACLLNEEIIDNDWILVPIERHFIKEPQSLDYGGHLYERRKGETNGYCLIWSMIFIHARMHYQDVPLNKLENTMFKNFHIRDVKAIPRAYASQLVSIIFPKKIIIKLHENIKQKIIQEKEKEIDEEIIQEKEKEIDEEMNKLYEKFGKEFVEEHTR